MKTSHYVLLLLALTSANGSPFESKHLRGIEEDSMSTTEIIQNRGYPAEVHQVTTADGYILQLHRIPFGLQSGPAAGKPVIFLQHGLLCSSTDWVVGPVHKSLAYMMADAGYDVWLGNTRGNTYGRNHTSLDADTDDAFWDFTFDMIGKYDVPTNLIYILTVTGQSQLTYVGHSQGTLTFWIAMENHPELNEKINMMFALAPVSTVAHMRSPIRLIAPYVENLQWIINNLGINEFLPSTDFFQLIGEQLCKENSTTVGICTNVLFLLCGPSVEQMDPSLLPLIVSHTPAGTSVRNMIHFAQEYNHAYYAKYDYGALSNLNHYGQLTPPLYDPKTTTAPVVFFSGVNDWLADPQDVAWLSAQLPNLRQHIVVEPFNHLDFLWAIDVDRYVNNIILDILTNPKTK